MQNKIRIFIQKIVRLHNTRGQHNKEVSVFDDPTDIQKAETVRNRVDFLLKSFATKPKPEVFVLTKLKPSFNNIYF